MKAYSERAENNMRKGENACYTLPALFSEAASSLFLRKRGIVW